MVDKELLEAIGQMMDEKLDRKLQPIVDRLDKLEESSEEVRSGVNALLEWAEECGNVIKFPLPKVKSAHKYSQTVPDIRCRLFLSL